jgi:hypothetical protein
LEHIKEKAKKQCFDFIFYGSDYFDLSKFDFNKPEYTIVLNYYNEPKSENTKDFLLFRIKKQKKNLKKGLSS